MECQPLSPKTLFSLDSSPDLLSKVNACICKNMFGTGTTDITGIGVMISFAMQFGITLLFWPIAFLDGYFIPAFKEDHQSLSVAKWVSEYHQKCLWAQLYFSVTLGLAGLFIQLQRETFVGVFENASIIASVDVTFLCLLLTTTSYSGNFDRPIVYSLGFFIVAVCTFITTIAPIWTSKVENLLRVCLIVVEKNNPAWNGFTLSPYSHMLPEVLVSVVICALLLGTWFWLARPLSRKMFRFLVIFMAFLSIFVIYEACDSLQSLFFQRKGMNEIWDGQTGQNVWGVGQIGAPLAWAPFLIDLTYPACIAVWGLLAQLWIVHK